MPGCRDIEFVDEKFVGSRFERQTVDFYTALYIIYIIPFKVCIKYEGYERLFVFVGQVEPVRPQTVYSCGEVKR